MIKKKKEKGSILLMSAVLLAAVVLIGTMIIVVFFRGFVDVSLDIRDYKEKLAAQVHAQEYYVSLDLNLIEEGSLPEGLVYDEENETYSFIVETEKYTISALLDKDLKIKKWNVKE